MKKALFFLILGSVSFVSWAGWETIWKKRLGEFGEKIKEWRFKNENSWKRKDLWQKVEQVLPILEKGPPEIPLVPKDDERQIREMLFLIFSNRLEAEKLFYDPENITSFLEDSKSEKWLVVPFWSKKKLPLSNQDLNFYVFDHRLQHEKNQWERDKSKAPNAKRIIRINMLAEQELFRQCMFDIKQFGCESLIEWLHPVINLASRVVKENFFDNPSVTEADFRNLNSKIFASMEKKHLMDHRIIVKSLENLKKIIQNPTQDPKRVQTFVTESFAKYFKGVPGFEEMKNKLEALENLIVADKYETSLVFQDLEKLDIWFITEILRYVLYSFKKNEKELEASKELEPSKEFQEKLINFSKSKEFVQQILMYKMYSFKKKETELDPLKEFQQNSIMSGEVEKLATGIVIYDLFSVEKNKKQLEPSKELEPLNEFEKELEIFKKSEEFERLKKAKEFTERLKKCIADLQKLGENFAGVMEDSEEPPNINKDGLPKDLKNMAMEYFNEATQWNEKSPVPMALLEQYIKKSEYYIDALKREKGKIVKGHIGKFLVEYDEFPDDAENIIKYLDRFLKKFLQKDIIKLKELLMSEETTKIIEGDSWEFFKSFYKNDSDHNENDSLHIVFFKNIINKARDSKDSSDWKNWEYIKPLISSIESFILNKYEPYERCEREESDLDDERDKKFEKNRCMYKQWVQKSDVKGTEEELKSIEKTLKLYMDFSEGTLWSYNCKYQLLSLYMRAMEFGQVSLHKKAEEEEEVLETEKGQIEKDFNKLMNSSGLRKVSLGGKRPPKDSLHDSPLTPFKDLLESLMKVKIHGDGEEKE